MRMDRCIKTLVCLKLGKYKTNLGILQSVVWGVHPLAHPWVKISIISDSKTFLAEFCVTLIHNHFPSISLSWTLKKRERETEKQLTFKRYIFKTEYLKENTVGIFKATICMETDGRYRKQRLIEFQACPLRRIDTSAFF